MLDAIPPHRTTVLICDDHPEMLESVREIVETDDSLELVAAAGGVAEAIKLGRETQPSVAVLDVNMPDGGGWAAARELTGLVPGIRLVAYSSFDNPLITRTMASAGISAFVVKGSNISMLLGAIHGDDVMPRPEKHTPLLDKTSH